MSRLFCIAGLLTLFTASWATADWPQFRGPDANGLSGAGATPQTWGEETNIRWQVKPGGSGWSQPIVVGGKVFITSATPVEQPAGVTQASQPPQERPEGQRRGDRAGNGGPGNGGPGNGGGGRGGPGGGRGFGGRPAAPAGPVRFEVICYDLQSGDELWRQTAIEAAPREPTHRDNTFATETPVSDGKRVIAYFGMMGVVCYDLNGELLWKKDLGAYPLDNNWGTASSPALADGLVFLQIDNEEDSFVVALDVLSGDERWRDKRTEKTNWCSPIIWRNKGRTELVCGGETVRAYEPKTGKVLWSLTIEGGRSCASPTGNDDLLIVGTEDRSSRGGGPGGLFAVKAGASGEVAPASGESTSEGVLWSTRRDGTSMASPLIYEGLVYLFDRNGAKVVCLKADTGEKAYQTRAPGGAAFWASPWEAGGKVFGIDEAGTTFVLAPKPEFEVLGKNELNGRFWSSPAVADGALLLRSEDTLYCIAKP
ncbi:outer membrane biogenesis protein BamB [Pirellulimonas nuda]|uniref:Outer membrane biogenesis protein BamB n=1 Tax=Pirellulimonas nuda TaxID=2528009 RepID=A0A518DI06_9BACT|nr:PQQ-binding-like beta-propeller repeat protein [Pirellulimonas nuda]QDU91109.1 outer membrane biogenesis protein BamB [Pirellulimonas nuda]